MTVESKLHSTRMSLGGAFHAPPRWDELFSSIVWWLLDEFFSVRADEHRQNNKILFLTFTYTRPTLVREWKSS